MISDGFNLKQVLRRLWQPKHPHSGDAPLAVETLLAMFWGPILNTKLVDFTSTLSLEILLEAFLVVQGVGATGSFGALVPFCPSMFPSGNLVLRLIKMCYYEMCNVLYRSRIRKANPRFVMEY